ncbi:hypothetical protein AB833_16135 [Chromatiales bacterium (ex Bugula neritina AB1)]|nr:hypothetical protein AB833_16135 [Chromatiales bacterium (ex Bugula neritina AB1)]
MPCHKSNNSRNSNFFKIALITTLTLTTLLSCTSPFVLGQLYDRAPKRAEKSLTRYAEFGHAQHQAIRISLRRYHRWHRETQLPEYAILLRSIAIQVQNESQVDVKTLKLWLDRIEHFSNRLRQCNPLNDSANLLKGLTDNQVEQISDRLIKEKDSELKEYQQKTDQQRLARRYKSTIKWARRIGLPFSSEQASLLKETLQLQKNLRPQRMALWRTWSEQFLHLLHNRSSPEFATRVNRHIDSLWSITKDNYPTDWQKAKTLWSEYLLKFLQLQSPQQNSSLAKSSIYSPTPLKNYRVKRLMDHKLIAFNRNNVL